MKTLLIKMFTRILALFFVGLGFQMTFHNGWLTLSIVSAVWLIMPKEKIEE